MSQKVRESVDASYRDSAASRGNDRRLRFRYMVYGNAHVDVVVLQIEGTSNVDESTVVDLKVSVL